jgi:hypothetical protein
MAQNQEGVDYRSILAGLLKDVGDLELTLQVARKILALPSTASQAMGVDLAEQVRPTEGAAVQFYPGQFYGKSQTAAAAEVLRIYGKPQKTKTILEAFTKAEFKIGGKSPEGTLYRSLLRGKEFLRVAPDTWGVADWYPEAKLKPLPMPVRGRKRRGRPPKRKATAQALKRTPVRESQTDKSEA